MEQIIKNAAEAIELIKDSDCSDDEKMKALEAITDTALLTMNVIMLEAMEEAA